MPERRTELGHGSAGGLLIADALCLLCFPLTLAARQRIQTELLACRREREPREN